MDLPVLNAEAKEALRRARAVASERGLNPADLTDILGALVDSKPAVRLLELFDAEPDKVRAAVAFIMSQGAPWLTDADAEDRTVDLARAEAARLGQDETGPEHLILALVRQQNSMPAGLLESMGLTVDSAREAVRYLHGQVPDWLPPTSLQSAFSWAPMEAVPGSMSEEDAARMLDMSMGNFEVGMSALDRVVGIGQAVEASGVVVEMIALEVREGGGVLYWRTETSEDQMLGDADIAFSDDLGTTYQVMPSGWSGSGRETRGQTLVVPKPPRGAQTLIIEVRSFGRMDWMPLPPSMSPPMEVTAGSWRFEVSLSQ